MSQNRIPVAILGATGPVGQKAIAMLANHPRFKIAELAASDQRSGRAYGECMDWREERALPSEFAAMKLKPIQEVESQHVISALPAEIAIEAEPMLAARGQNVYSNASAYRMGKEIPLLVPEVNGAHLALVNRQSTPGKIITNPNCSTVFLVGALRPLQDLGVIEHVNVVTMQSLSGAGYPGVPSFDLIGNVIPHISGEEDKIQAETKKILGEVESPARFGVTVHVHRVPVLYGHLVALHVRFASAVTARDVRAQFTAWNEKFPGLFVIHDRPDRPQPARDLSAYDMSFHVGRIKQGDDPRVVGLVSLGHNLVRGAAGAAIANMEAFLNSSEAE